VGTPKRPEFAGIRIELVRIGVYATSAALAAFAGVLLIREPISLLQKGTSAPTATLTQHHRSSIGRGGAYGRRRKQYRGAAIGILVLGALWRRS